MKTRYLALLTVLAIGPNFAQAGPRGTTIEDAIDVLDDLADAPEKRIPPALLKDAAAVIIAPDVMKAGFIVGGRHGHGVLLVRTKDGWSDPVFVTISGGSVGWQAGIQATDLFLVIRNPKSLDRILSGGGKLTLGAEASVAAGPVGRDASAATDLQLKAGILSYSRSRGIFGGVALDGDAITIDYVANDRFYGERRIRVSDIIDGKAKPPKQAEKLKGRLGDWTSESKTTTRPAPAGADEKK